jgi:hypothetical protein
LESFICFNTIINIDEYKDNLKIGDFKNKYKDYKNFIRYITILNKLEFIIFIAFINDLQYIELSMPSTLSQKSSNRDYKSDFKRDQSITKNVGKKIIRNKMFKNMQEPEDAYKKRNKFTHSAIRVA